MAAPKMPPSPFSDYPAFLRQSMKRVVGNPASDREAAYIAQSQKAVDDATRRKYALREAERKFRLAMDPNSGLPRDLREAYLNEHNLLFADPEALKKSFKFDAKQISGR